MMNMKNYITALLLLLFTLTGFAQTVVPSGSANQVTDFKGGVKVEKTLNLPVTDAEPFPGQDKLGQVRISPTDSIVRYFNGVDWVKVTSEENDYVTKSELADSVSLARQFALDKDTLRVPYTGAAKPLNLGVYNMYSGAIGAGYGSSGLTSVPAWLSARNPTIPSTGNTSTVFGVYNSVGVRSLYVYADETDTQYFNNRGGGNQASNSAMGNYALSKNTTGTYINAYGYGALQENTTGILNLAIGYASLNKNTTGTRNLGIGSYSLINTTTGSFNTAVGAQNLISLTTGKANTVIGQGVATSLTEGNYNTIIGRHWGGSDNNAADRFTAGSYNTVITPGVDETDAVGINFSVGSYNTFIGNVKNIGNNINNTIIIADGQNNRAFEKSSSGAVTMTGTSFSFNNTITAPSYSSFKAATFGTATKVTPDVQNISDSPVASEVYHDLLAFNASWSTALFQTSADGSAWNTGTVNNNLFNQKESQLVSYSDKYIRWIWNSSQIAYCQAKWLKLNWAYLAGTYNRTVVLETSTDGITWTTRHSSISTAVQTPEFFYLQDWLADTYVRLTISNNGTADIPLSGIKILTARAGNQGRGKEFEYPYDWDADRNIIFNGYTKTTTMRSKGSGLSFANTSGAVWGGFDETSGRLTLNNAPTAGSNGAVRAVDIQFTIPSYIAVTSAYTTGTARTITANGTFIITLATTGIPDGMEYCIKNIGSGSITISGTIDGVSGATLTAGQVLIVRKTGSTFIKIN